ncbi:MAG: 50S ribosomal protein L4 [Candidatus Woykebacteria bacterium RBG_13_40_7b]|uniref:Large ribosomal subunit protein uL4 n=1 Tax=Candidatus Woykebacteria bacterium RBG_13_40_7b TaxID=1802594 RepID=A0A1G1W8V5_9BACT|nr:MAG: 50S ribosomal protein L4 [Candidatus Woykebacteria bacterium RBG_13_40_7b]
MIDKVELPKEIFGLEVKKELLAQAVRVHLASQRKGLASTKTKGQVRGGGRKPWRQKGTGRARVGSIRVPQFRGGGVVFGPKPKSFKLELPKKMRKKAALMALSDKVKGGDLVVLDKFQVKEPKTKEAAKILNRLPLEKKTTFLIKELDVSSYLATRNLPNLNLLRINNLNTYNILNSNKLLLTLESIQDLKKFFMENKL